ncbi:MAG: D-aminoacyl-tRNA deacylase [Thermoplasmata archaeon]
MVLPPYVLVASESDPVARAVAELWGTLPATGDHVDGVPLRRFPSGALLLHRQELHIRDDHLDRSLPTAMRQAETTLVFPSIHRSERNVPCLTVHPLGNPGPSAEVGGRPRTLVPTDPPRMADALRRLDEREQEVGLKVTFEATHHGPELELPAFFVEIGFGTMNAPPIEAVRAFAEVLPELRPSPKDRVALAVGGGHYAPHFTELVRERDWAFGHILSRHALAEVDRETARHAYLGSRGADGIVTARAEDLILPALEGIGPRLKDADAPRRAPTGASTVAASGT